MSTCLGVKGGTKNSQNKSGYYKSFVQNGVGVKYRIP